MKNKTKRQFLFTILSIFLMLVFMVSYIMYAFYNNSVANINELGVSNMKREAAVL